MEEWNSGRLEQCKTIASHPAAVQIEDVFNDPLHRLNPVTSFFVNLFMPRPAHVCDHSTTLLTLKGHFVRSQTKAAMTIYPAVGSGLAPGGLFVDAAQVLWHDQPFRVLELGAPFASTLWIRESGLV